MKLVLVARTYMYLCTFAWSHATTKMITCLQVHANHRSEIKMSHRHEAQYEVILIMGSKENTA